MVLSVPSLPSRASGLRLTSTVWKADITDVGNFFANPPIFISVQTAAQSIPDSTVTAIAMNNTSIDSYVGHSDTVNNTRYTATAAGWYLLIGSVSYAVNATGNRIAEFRKNGAASAVALGQGAHPTTDTSNNPTPRASSIIYMNGTSDYVELYAYQTSGGALNTVPGQSGFAAVWLHS
jgi:hypothetical protein